MLFPSLAGACAAPASVKSFHGHAEMRMVLSAVGEDPGLGGSETVSLERVAQLKLNLTDKLIGKHGEVVFGGRIKGGSASVGDSIENSGSGFEGSATYGGPLTPHRPDFGSANLILSRRGCKYELILEAGAHTGYSGDQEVKPPLYANYSAYAGPQPLPHSLRLSGHLSVDARLSCDNTHECFEFGGTWTTDFATLALCHSVTVEHCKSDRTPVGSAGVGWSLSPVFEPHRKNN